MENKDSILNFVKERKSAHATQEGWGEDQEKKRRAAGRDNGSCASNCPSCNERKRKAAARWLQFEVSGGFKILNHLFGSTLLEKSRPTTSSLKRTNTSKRARVDNSIRNPTNPAIPPYLERWGPLLQISGNYYLELVCEFYANMFHKTDKDLSTIISTAKSVRIILDKERLTSLLGIRDKGNTITTDSKRKSMMRTRIGIMRRLAIALRSARVRRRPGKRTLSSILLSSIAAMLGTKFKRYGYPH
ncbi:hypothetical protein M9H77_35288 [Catharanthus roseus]|uniref:Uncharacterized protein n=1 Tax=Catharanthus roseus TaxID=4058 RepID=A0ACB9ZQH5_CATRO|nr:hypothetical protein M9H77_35288 [Catharanthus roseus]